MAWANSLFYIAFLSQTLLISYNSPNKLFAGMRNLLATYPPETYPTLYLRCAVLSLGYTLRNINPDDIDFDVYRNDAATA